MAEENDIGATVNRHPTRKYFRRLAVIATAAALFSTMYIAGASDEGITELVGRWSDKTFHFRGAGKESAPSEIAGSNQSIIEGEYDSIEAALAECEIPESTYPKWLPDRFILEKISVMEAEQRFCAVRSRYSGSDKNEVCIIEIMKFYNISDASSYVFEKDDTPVVEYEKNGIVHYLLKNPAGDLTAWNNGNLVCSIAGDLSTDEFKSIIDSIYKS